MSEKTIERVKKMEELLDKVTPKVNIHKPPKTAFIRVPTTPTVIISFIDFTFKISKLYRILQLFFSIVENSLHSLYNLSYNSFSSFDNDVLFNFSLIKN